MPQITCNVSDFLDYMSGNQGLTKKIIHYDKKNLGINDIEVLSSSIVEDTSMGYVSRNLVLPNKKHIKIFEDKEGILVSRNGNAGILTYLPKGKYTMNDHAYILYIKEKFIRDIDTHWLSLALQKESLKFLSITEGNKTWNITRFINEGKIAIPTLEDGSYDIEKQKEIALKYKEIEKQKQILIDKIEYLKNTKIDITHHLSDFKLVKFNKMFKLERGNIISKAFVTDNKGDNPVYSTQKGIFGCINSYMKDGKYLLWNTDGLAGYIKITNGKFSYTNIVGIMIPTNHYDMSSIDLDYLKYYLEPIFRKNRKGRFGINGKNEYTKLNSTMIKKLDIDIPIPTKEDGSYDIKKQEEIAQKIATIESIKQDLYNKVKELTSIVVT